MRCRCPQGPHRPRKRGPGTRCKCHPERGTRPSRSCPPSQRSSRCNCPRCRRSARSAGRHTARTSRWRRRQTHRSTLRRHLLLLRCSACMRPGPPSLRKGERGAWQGDGRSETGNAFRNRQCKPLVSGARRPVMTDQLLQSAALAAAARFETHPALPCPFRRQRGAEGSPRTLWQPRWRRLRELEEHGSRTRGSKAAGGGRAVVAAQWRSSVGPGASVPPRPAPASHAQAQRRTRPRAWCREPPNIGGVCERVWLHAASSAVASRGGASEIRMIGRRAGFVRALPTRFTLQVLAPQEALQECVATCAPGGHVQWAGEAGVCLTAAEEQCRLVKGGQSRAWGGALPPTRRRSPPIPPAPRHRPPLPPLRAR